MTRVAFVCVCLAALAGLSGCDVGGELAIPKVSIINGGTSSVSAQAAALGASVPAGTQITFLGDIVRLRGQHFRPNMKVYLGLNNALARRPGSLLTTARDFLPAGPFAYTDPATNITTILEVEVPFEFIREDEVLIAIPPEVSASNAFTNPIVRVFGDKGSSLPIADVYFVTGPRYIAAAPKRGLDIGGYDVVIHGDFFSPFTQVAVRYRDPGTGQIRVLGDEPADDIRELFVDRFTLVIPDWPGVVPNVTFGLTDELSADILLFENIEAITSNVALEPELNGRGALKNLLPQGDAPLNSNGTRNTERLNAFTYLPSGVTAPPLIQALTPDSGTEVGGNMVVIHGQQFDAFTVDLSDPTNTGVAIECPPGSGEFIAPLAASLIDRHTIVVTMPPCPVDVPEKVDIALRNKFTIDNAGNLGGLPVIGPDGTRVVFDDVYTYIPIPPIVPPIVTAIYPSSGNPQPQGIANDYGLQSLLIVGDWFDGDTTLNGGVEFLLPGGEVVQTLRTKLHNRNLLEVFTPRLPSGVYPLSSDIVAGLRVRNVVGHADFPASMIFTATPDAGAAPVLDQICPTNGPLAGGNRILLFGSNFDTTTRVLFGAVPSPDVQFFGSGILAAQVPAGLPAGPVAVRAEDGGELSTPQTYTLTGSPDPTAPILAALAPDLGSATGGYNILAYGVHFTPTVRAEFGVGDGNFSNSIFFASDMLVQIEVPEALPEQIGATVQVGVTDPLNGNHTPIKTVGFTYVAPQMAAPEILYVDTTVEVPVTPTPFPALTLSGGDGMLVIGKNFDQRTTFDVTKDDETSEATGVRVLNPNIAVMRSPASPDGNVGVAALQAHNAFGDSNEFTVEYVAPPPPVILDVRNLDDGTNSAPIDGNDRLLVFGDGFFDDAGGLRVRLTGRDLANPASRRTVEFTGAQVTLVDDDIIGVNVPPNTFLEGPLEIEVETIYGIARFEDDDGEPIFVLVGPRPPEVLGVFPRLFHSGGGEEAVFFGRNFTPTTEFRVRTQLMGFLVPVLSPRFVSESVVIVTMPSLLGGMPPAGVPGLVRATETNAALAAKISDPDFTESSLADPLYRVVNDAAPVLFAVYPDHGSIDGGEQVLLLGANFLTTVGAPNVSDVRIVDPVLGDLGNYTPASSFDLPLNSLDPSDRGKYFILNDHSILLITHSRAPIPIGDAAPANVILESPNGSSQLAGGYTYLDTPAVIQPVLLGITPNETRLNGGTSHLLSGAFLSGIHRIVLSHPPTGATFTIPLHGGSFDVVNSFFDVFVMPDLSGTFAAGQVLNVRVEKDVPGIGTLVSNTLTASLKVTFGGPPVITPALSPSLGSAFGGTVVEITGAFFTTNSQVLFGTMPAPIVVFDSPTRLFAVAPSLPLDAPAGGLDLLNVAGSPDPTVDVAVFTQGGWAVLADAFTFTPQAPALDSLAPDCVLEGSTTRMTLFGSRFLRGDTTLSVASGSVSVVSVFPDRVVFDYTAPTFPPGTVGPVDLAIAATTSHGTSSSSLAVCIEVAPFMTDCTTTYTLNPEASPSTGVYAGARILGTIEGGNFEAGAKLWVQPRIGNPIQLSEVSTFTASGQFRVVDGQTIEFTVPYALNAAVPTLIDGNPKIGPVSLLLVNPNGLRASLSEAFAYVPVFVDFEEYRYTVPATNNSIDLTAPGRLAVGDINADGIADAAVLAYQFGTEVELVDVILYFGDHFGPGVDVNGDGVTPDFAGTFTTVLATNETVATNLYALGVRGQRLRLANLDGDAALEIVAPAIVASGSNPVRVLLVDIDSAGAVAGTHVLTPSTPAGQRTTGIAVGNFSSSHTGPDIAILIGDDDMADRHMVVFTSTSTPFVFGQFSKDMPASLERYSTGALAAGDFDGDGDDDLIWGNVWDDLGGYLPDMPILVAKVDASTNTVFDPSPLSNLSGQGVIDIEIADLDGNGNDDAIVLVRHAATGPFFGAPPVTRFGGFAVVRDPLGLEADAYIETNFRLLPNTAEGTGNSLALGDTNADGLLDLAAMNDEGEFILYFGTGGSFIATGRSWTMVPSPKVPFIGTRAESIRLFDVNGDGLAEAWVGDMGGPPFNLSLWLNRSR